MAAQQAQDLRQIYHHIIDDVVAKMKPGFLQESIDESVLQTIRQRWSQKLKDKGIISDPEPQPVPPAAAKIDSAHASRKRPYDGASPNNRQEAAASGSATGGSSGAALPPSATAALPVKLQPEHMQLPNRPTAQVVPAGVSGMLAAQPQAMFPRGMLLQGVPGAPQQRTGLPQQLPNLHPNLLASTNAPPQQHNLTQQQQQAQSLHMQLQAALQQQQQHNVAQAQLRPPQLGPGMPGQAQLRGMQVNQGLPGQQLQGLVGLRPQGIPHQGLQHAGLTQQQQQQQQMLLHQQLLQQQQQQQQQQALHMPGHPAGLAANVQQPNLQALLQQGALQRIPQNDGSADPQDLAQHVGAALASEQQHSPQHCGEGSADVLLSVCERGTTQRMLPSMEELAATAGLQPAQLRAVMPRRIAAIIDKDQGTNGNSNTTAAAAAASGDLHCAEVPVHAADCRHNRARVRRRPRIIPQVDGNGDEEGDDEEEDFVGGGQEDDDDDDPGAGDGGEGEDDDEDDDEDDIASDSNDEQEMDKFNSELDKEEQADKMETGDVGFALYEKVHRAKNRWRCNLRFGVFMIDGKEYMFNKGNTDFMF